MHVNVLYESVVLARQNVERVLHRSVHDQARMKKADAICDGRYDEEKTIDGLIYDLSQFCFPATSQKKTSTRTGVVYLTSLNVTTHSFRLH